MKLIISTIVGAIIFFLLGWLIYGVILADYLGTLRNLMRPSSDMKWWALIVAQVLHALILSYLYMKTYKGESPFKEGFLFGLAIGILMSAPYVFYLWSSYKVSYRSAIGDGAVSFIMNFIVGIVIGLIFGKKEKQEIKETS